MKIRLFLRNDFVRWEVDSGPSKQEIFTTGIMLSGVLEGTTYRSMGRRV